MLINRVGKLDKSNPMSLLSPRDQKMFSLNLEIDGYIIKSQCSFIRRCSIRMECSFRRESSLRRDFSIPMKCSIRKVCSFIRCAWPKENIPLVKADRPAKSESTEKTVHSESNIPFEGFVTL